MEQVHDNVSKEKTVKCKKYLINFNIELTLSVDKSSDNDCTKGLGWMRWAGRGYRGWAQLSLITPGDVSRHSASRGGTSIADTQPPP